jgi:hypothetical protein
VTPVTDTHGLCPFYLLDSYRCNLTGKSCLCEPSYQSRCTRRYWALEYQGKLTGQPLPGNGPQAIPLTFPHHAMNDPEP